MKFGEESTMRRLMKAGLLLGLGLLSALLVLVGTGGDALPRSVHPNQQRVTDLEQLWQGQYVDYFGRDRTVPALDADQIGERLGGLSQETGQAIALIYVAPQPDYLELLLVMPDQAVVRETVETAPLDRVLATASQFQAAVHRPFFSQASLLPAQQLYRWMVAPLEAYLQAKSVDVLIFCPGPGLRSLPWAALHDGSQFLVETYAVGLIPAFNLVDHRVGAIADATILAMGASEFEELGDLPAVPLELAAVAENFRQGEQFLNQAFTLENLKQQLSSAAFRIVHLATHAQFQPGTPANSYIQLWQDERLNLSQLHQLDWRDLPVELLVLSACETALGDRTAELGFAGLSFEAGVKTTLASLWQVSDLGTLALMTEFYAQLADPTVPTKAEALRRAQVAMLQGDIRISDDTIRGPSGSIPLPQEFPGQLEGNLSPPFYWAAFTLVGSPW
ncbi:MAG: CHAT domain-containing protein [Synechococcales bacterium]|nr:CHAT domain-containing protein [Synechococcales bacterium]